MPPTDPRWLSMTAPEVYNEFRQIVAYRYEEKHPGKLFAESDGDAIIDENFDEYLASLGVIKE